MVAFDCQNVCDKGELCASERMGHFRRTADEEKHVIPHSCTFSVLPQDRPKPSVSDGLEKKKNTVLAVFIISRYVRSNPPVLGTYGHHLAVNWLIAPV